jgi:hypothetical protein
MLRSTEAPPQEAGRIFGCVYDVQRDYFQKGKDSSAPVCGELPLRELLESDNLARFHHTQQTSTTTGLTTGPSSGIEQQIISSIKTFRKEN